MCANLHMVRENKTVIYVQSGGVYVVYVCAFARVYLHLQSVVLQIEKQ